MIERMIQRAAQRQLQTWRQYRAGQTSTHKQTYTDIHMHADRMRQAETGRDRQRQAEAGRDRQRHAETERQAKRDRERQRETERDRERQRQRERESERVMRNNIDFP